AEMAPFYIFTAFVFAYGTNTLHFKRDFLIFSVLAGAVLSFVTIPLAGHLSDRFGRKRIYLIGAIVTALYGLAYFHLLNTRIPALVFIGSVLSLVPHDIMYGPQAALIAESFSGHLRYSGASLGYQLASVFAGGPAPLIAAWLFGKYHSGWPISIYIAGCGIVSIVATSLLRDYTRKDIA
ncbi:MAG TPA: MFS transporter, partial [Thermoanaerobaculia bacterium]|nr:MFS transporter [Thermoanaerobaculia bacterium]